MANSSKIKEPLKFGWLISEEKYHITIISLFNSRSCYACLCNSKLYLDEVVPTIHYNRINNFIWPDGVQCLESLSKDTICKKCLGLYGEDLTFPLIKAKLGVKNPFD